MSRWEFMRRLEELLSDISPSEREEALQYYNEYINDAGRENEEEVIRSLGSPEQVAESVKEGLGEAFNDGEFSEKGFSSAGGQSINPLIRREADPAEEKEEKAKGAGSAAAPVQQTQSGQYTNGTADAAGEKSHQEKTAGKSQTVSVEAAAGKAKEKEKLPTWAIVLIVIGCIFLSPVIFGLAASLLGIIISVFSALFGMILGIGAASLALAVAGVALLVIGFSSLFTYPLAAIGLLGAGLICLALAILFMMLEVFLCGICLPGIVKGLIYICQKLFSKKEVA